MDDLYHYYGSDLDVSATGDLQSVSGVDRSQQRVLRRLLTNPGEYLAHPEYGAGLPKMVGEVTDVPKIKALIIGQMLLEPSVSKMPAPIVDVQAIAGGISCQFLVSM
jgi:hypothetical protein